MALCWRFRDAWEDVQKLNSSLFEVREIANNVLYFNDRSDYPSALWEILKVVAPDLFEEDDMPKLEYMGEDDD